MERHMIIHDKALMANTEPVGSGSKINEDELIEEFIEYSSTNLENQQTPSYSLDLTGNGGNGGGASKGTLLFVYFLIFIYSNIT